MTDLGYSQDEDGIITLTMTRADFERIIFLLGVAGGTTLADAEYFRLIDRINRGNVNWSRYFEGAPE